MLLVLKRILLIPIQMRSATAVNIMTLNQVQYTLERDIMIRVLADLFQGIALLVNKVIH